MPRQAKGDKVAFLPLYLFLERHPVPSDASPVETEILNRLPAARRSPVDLAACREIGFLLRRLSDPARRAALLVQILDNHPDEAAAAVSVADGMARAGMGERERDPALIRAGAAVLQRALRAGPAPALARTIHANLAFLHNELEDYPAAERHGRAAEGCENHIYHLWLAEALFFQRNYASDPLCVIDFTTFETEFLQKMANEATAEWSAFAPAAASTQDVVFLQSVDAVYFKRFALPQALSAHRFNPTVHFHFHIINPDDECLSLLDKMRRSAPGLRLDATAERRPSAGQSADRVYYACSRLLIARQIMRQSNAVVVIVDADILFRADPAPLLAQTVGYDLAAIRYSGEPMCNRYNASFFVIRRTLPSFMFLRMLEAFLEANFRRGYLWMIDQVALYCCEQRLRTVTQGGVRMLHWPETVVSIHQLPESPIWSGATSAKWTDTPYDRLRRSLLAQYGFNPAELEASA